MKKKEIGKKGKQKPQQPLPVSLHLFAPQLHYAVFAAIAGFLLYVNTIASQYVLDDAAVITGNTYVMKGLKGIPALFTIDIWHFLNLNLGYYRPLSLVTFAVENQFFPGNPHVSHLGNVIFFALTGFFLCLLLMRIFKYYHPAFAFFITLLFMAHPVHTEVVANIKSRDELLSFLNLVIALYLLLKAQHASPGGLPASRKGLLWFASVFFFYLALLSKETAVAGVFLVPAVLIFEHGFQVKKILPATIPFILFAGLFQLQKYVLIGSVTGVDARDIVNYPYTEMAVRLPAALALFAYGVKLLFIPYPLSYNYAYDQIPVEGWNQGWVILGVILLAGLVYLAVRKIRHPDVLTLGIWITGITLAPALGFVLLKGGIFAERFLYAPILGFSVVVVWLLWKLLTPFAFAASTTLKEIGGKAKFSVPFLLLCILYSAGTIARNTNWYDNLTLYAHDAEITPNSGQVHLHYGAALLAEATNEKDDIKRGDILNHAFQQLYQAIRIYPSYAEATYDIGWAYQQFNISNDSAIYYLNRALLQAPHYSKACFSLGAVYAKMGKQQLASYYYNRGVELNPYDPVGLQTRDAHRKLTGLDVKVFPSSENRDPVELNTPDSKKDFDFYNKMGSVYGQKGDLENAVRCLEQAVALNPTSPQALVNLSVCYGMMKNYNKSIEVLNKMLAIHPDDVQALRNLAASYEAVGDKVKMHQCEDKIKALGGR